MQLKSINIKGKEYVTVNARIKYFNEHFQKWRIETSFPMLDDGQCLCEAKIFDEENRQVRNGHAHEFRTGNINTTSMIENAETSAVGRALGMLGIGIDNSVASADEVRMAIEQQETLNAAPFPTPSKATAADKNRLFNKFNDLCDSYGVDAKEFVIAKLGLEVYENKQEMYKSIRHYMNKQNILNADLEAFIDRPAYAS